MLKLRFDAQTGKLLSAYPAEFEVPAPYAEVTEEENEKIQGDAENYYYYIDGKLTTKPKKEVDQQEYWENNFFKTSLGWIRRKPVMKDGTVKDFLNDCLPVIQMGLTQAGLPAGAVIRYGTPDFSKELTTEYLETLQDYSAITYEQGLQFIQECIARFLQDFTG